MRNCLIIMSCLVVLCACTRDSLTGRESSQTCTVRVSAKCSGLSKSSFASGENRIRDLNVFLYRNGYLESALYSEGDALDAEMAAGGEYELFALVNTGPVTAPGKMSELPSMRIPCPSSGSDAIPMSNIFPLSYTASAGSPPVGIPVQRLVAKYTLCLDKRLEMSDFEITDVSLQQVASDVSPFSGESAAIEVVRGDVASASDIVSLNNGGTAYFFVPENCQGVLLPDNLSPSGKVPSSIPDKSGLCTYMEVTGRWTTAGASAPLVLRMYLGQDNSTDFNVRRSTSCNLTLILSDDGMLLSSWKAEMGEKEDGRSVHFQTDRISVYQGGGRLAVPIIAEPEGVGYRVDCPGAELAAAGLSYEVEGDILYLSSSYTGVDRPVAHLSLDTWDGVHCDDLEVTVTYEPLTFTSYVNNLPSFIYEYGYLSFPDADEENRVLFSCGDLSWDIGGDYNGMQTFSDREKGIVYYFLPDRNKVYVRSEKAWSGEVIITLSRQKEAVDIHLHAPDYPQYDLEEVSLSESGNGSYDQGLDLYYDRRVALSLCDRKGNSLEFNRFAYPDDILDGLGYERTNDERYTEITDMFSNVSVSFSRQGLMGAFVNVPWYDDFADCRLRNAAASVYLYGLSSDGLDISELEYTVVNRSFPAGSMQGKARASVRACFPSQRYLGEYTNWQIAPGDMRSDLIAMDITSNGLYPKPSGSGIEWTVRHALLSPDGHPGTPEWVSDDSYSDGIVFSPTGIELRPVTPSRYPACGAMVIEGKVTNPHSGRTIEGTYSMDVVLYCPIGVQVDFYDHVYSAYTSRAVGYSFVPFCEYSSSAYAELWRSFFPQVPVVTWGGQGIVNVPESVEDNSFFQDGQFPTPPFSFSQALYSLSGMENRYFRFDFNMDGARTRTLEITRESYDGGPVLSSYADGMMGYYRLVRQYDVGNLSKGAKYYGLENYVVEAAYDSFELY